MALVFGNDTNIRGCFHAYHFAASASRGTVLQLPSGDDLPTRAQESSDNLVTSVFADPYLVTGFSFTQREAVTFVKTFGNRVYTYAFGHDPNPSFLTVDFMAFLVDGEGASDAMATFINAYGTQRVSASPENYAKLGFPSGSSDLLRGLIIGMSSATADGEHSLQKVSMQLALPQVQ